MPGLIIWKNQHINRIRKDMDRLFNRMWGEFGLSPIQPMIKGTPFLDLTETEKDLVLRAEIPGMDPNDFEISIVDDILTIKGETKQEIFEGKADHHRMERRYGSFSRRVQLPCRVSIDDVRATYQKGILKITMPKCAPETARSVKVLSK